MEQSEGSLAGPGERRLGCRAHGDSDRGKGEKGEGKIDEEPPVQGAFGPPQGDEPLQQKKKCFVSSRQRP